MIYVLLVIVSCIYFRFIWQEAQSHNLACHRRNDRCYGWARNKNWRVCSRCMMMYLGLGLLPLSYFLTRGMTSIIELAVLSVSLQIPMLLDGYTQYSKKRKSNNLLRTITGLCSGLGLSLIVIISIKVMGSFV